MKSMYPNSVILDCNLDPFFFKCCVIIVFWLMFSAQIISRLQDKEIKFDIESQNSQFDAYRDCIDKNI